MDLEAELVSALCDLRRERKECRHLKRNVKELEDELKKSNDSFESTEAMMIELKLKLEEARITEESLNKLIMVKDKEIENLKSEVVLLRKKVQESNMNHSSSILNQIIESQRSVNDKSGLGYKAAVINDGSSSSLKETGAEKKNEKGVDENSMVEK